MAGEVRVKDDDERDSKGRRYEDALKQKYGKGDNLPSWMGRTFDRANNDLLNFRVDSTANGLNFLGWLTGGNQKHTPESVLKSPIRPGGTMDPFRRGGAPKPASSTSRKPGYGTEQHQRDTRRAQDATYANEEKASEGALGSIEDYMARISGHMGGGSDWGALESQARSNFDANDSRLQAMYRALSGSIDADAPQLAATYDTASKEVQDGAANAVAQITAGYDAARNAQTEQLQALGIEEAAGTLAADGGGTGFAAQDQAEGTGRAAVQGQTSGNALSENKATALEANTGRSQNALQQGNEQRFLLQRDLGNRLADIQMARSQEESQRRGSLYEMAMSLRNQDMEAGTVDAQQQFDNEMAMAKLIQEQEQNAYQNTSRAQEQQRQLMLELLKVTDGDAQRATDIFNQYYAQQ